MEEYKMYYIIIRMNYNQLIETVIWRWGSNIDEHYLLFFFFNFSMYNYRMQQTELVVKQQGKFS